MDALDSHLQQLSLVLTEEQERLFDLTARRVVLRGYAGTGKTTLMEAKILSLAEGLFLPPCSRRFLTLIQNLGLKSLC